MQDLKLEKLWVVYPGKTGYPMAENIECVSFADLGRVEGGAEMNRDPQMTQMRVGHKEAQTAQGGARNSFRFGLRCFASDAA
jgi:hypothetical protein